MPSYKDFFPGTTYLQQDDVGPGKVLTIHRFETVEFDGGDRGLVAHFYEDLPPWRLNKTNCALLEHYTGAADWDAWVGLQVELWADPSVMMKNERVGGIRVKNVRGTQAEPRMTNPEATLQTTTGSRPASSTARGQLGDKAKELREQIEKAASGDGLDSLRRIAVDLRQNNELTPWEFDEIAEVGRRRRVELQQDEAW